MSKIDLIRYEGMIKVSIIVPVYNVEQYLEKCLFSCVNQTLEEIEVIVINDASPDNSDRIMKKFQKIYPMKMVTIYLDKNLRQGGARNRGIKAARGEYLCFVDGDDYIELTTCEQLYNFSQERGLDIACCDGWSIKNGKSSYFEAVKREDMLSLSSIKNFTSQCYMIIKKSLIVSNELLYPENIYHEDTAVVPLWYICSSKRDMLNMPLYNINRHEGSTTTSKKAVDNIQILNALEELVKNANRINKYSEFKTEIDSFIFGRILVLVKKIIGQQIVFSKEEKNILSSKMSVWSDYRFDETNFYRFFTKMDCILGKKFILNCMDNDFWTVRKNNNDTNYYIDISGRINALLHYIRNDLKRPIVIWGAGVKGVSIINTVKNMGYDYFVGDNNNNLWNKKIETGDLVRDYAWIEENVENPFFIITATRYFRDICCKLALEDKDVIDMVPYMEHDLQIEDYLSIIA